MQKPFSLSMGDIKKDCIVSLKDKTILTRPIREGCKIENRLNLGHCPNRREGGPKDCPNVPTLILNLIFNIINSNVVQHNSNVVQHTSNVVTLIEDESSKPSSSPPPSFCLV